MKKTITVSYEDEKLTALKMYLEQKNQTVEGELAIKGIGDVSGAG